jgi:BMFP domain-containing protein YqiC
MEQTHPSKPIKKSVIERAVSDFDIGLTDFHDDILKEFRSTIQIVLLTLDLVWMYRGETKQISKHTSGYARVS